MAPDADRLAIKAAWRAKSLLTHPDKVGPHNTGANEAVSAVKSVRSHAYRHCLSNLATSWNGAVRAAVGLSVAGASKATSASTRVRHMAVHPDEDVLQSVYKRMECCPKAEVSVHVVGAKWR